MRPGGISQIVTAVEKGQKLISVLLSVLSPQGVLAAQSNFLWVNILMVAIIGMAAIAAAVALKKS